MNTSIEKKYSNLIILIQAFENLWTYYYVSEGELCKKEAKESALTLIDYFEVVYQLDSNVYNSKHIAYNNTDSEKFVRDVLMTLKEWANNGDLFPFSQLGASDNELSQGVLQGFLRAQKEYVTRKLDLDVLPTLMASSGQNGYHKNSIRWKGHLHEEAIDFIAEGLVSKMSDTDTIVLIADIRKSQDLMTYGPDADFFRDKILEFTTEMRRIIKNHYGVFDKFTGDGFLCYFNSHLCERFGVDYYEQVVKSCNEIMQFSEAFFKDWVKNIRKLPPNSSGLTIGIDSGIVKFRDLDNHLFAIGDSIIWANRMSSSGEKGEIILNNIPYHQIKEKCSKLEFESFVRTTKGGESFVAYKMKINKVD